MRGLDRRLARWQAAGLIDAASVEAIRNFEKTENRPVLVWAVASLALLALGLGLVLLIGANWDEIPATMKLAVQFAAMIAAAASVAHGWRRASFWQAEAALFLLAALVLAGIALQGQIYQQSAPFWQAFAFWLVLAGPALLLLGRSWLTGSLVSLMLEALMIALASHGFDQRGFWQAVFVGSAGAIPFLLVSAAALLPTGPFRLAAAGFGLVYVLAGASLAHFAWSGSISPSDSRDALEALILPAISFVIAMAVSSKFAAEDRLLVRVILAASFVAGAIAISVPHASAWYWQLLGVVLFCAMWGAIIAAAAANGWLSLYRLGVAVIALRLVVVYFELFGTLALTGIGLIGGGLLVLMLLLIWNRARKRLKRGREEVPA